MKSLRPNIAIPSLQFLFGSHEISLFEKGTFYIWPTSGLCAIIDLITYNLKEKQKSEKKKKINKKSR